MLFTLPVDKLVGVDAMTGSENKTMSKQIAGVLAALAVLATPVAVLADASAPWVGKKVAKKKAAPRKRVVRKRRSAVRSVRRARPAPQPEPQVAAVEPVYQAPPEPVVAPEPVYTPPPAPEPVVAPTPAAVPVPAAAPSSGGGFPLLAVLGGLAAIGAVVAVASSGSDSP